MSDEDDKPRRPDYKERLKKGATVRKDAPQDDLLDDDFYGCDMIMTDGHHNPMMVAIKPKPIVDPTAARGAVTGIMDDDERDAFITSIEEKAQKLVDSAWGSLEWQVAWQVAESQLSERMAGVMDNPEDDSLAADESPGRRTMRSVPRDTLNPDRFRSLLHESLGLVVLGSFAKESGLSEEVASRLVEGHIRRANEKSAPQRR